MTRHLNSARFRYRPLHFPSSAKLNKTKIILIMWNVGHIVNFFLYHNAQLISDISNESPPKQQTLLCQVVVKTYNCSCATSMGYSQSSVTVIYFSLHFHC